MNYLLCSLESSCCFGDLLIFDECKFGENLNFLNYAVVWHQLSHRGFVVMLRNASQPKFPNQNVTGFFSNYLFRAWNRIIHRYTRRGDCLMILIRRPMHWSVVLVRHIRSLILHGWILIWVHFIHRHFPAVEVVFDVHLPSRKLFLQSSNDFVSEGLVAAHSNKCIAEHIESPSWIIAFDHPE